MKISYNTRRCCVFLSVLVALLLAMSGDSESATYVVGDSLGWTVPPNGPSAYATWASQHVFGVGDVLVCNFTTGIHDVAKSHETRFDSCSSNSPIALVTVGPASLTLNSTSSEYYICTFGQHCSLGQKLAINVSSASYQPYPVSGTIELSSSNAIYGPNTNAYHANATTSSSLPPSSMSLGPAPSGTMMPSPISPAPESAARPPPRDFISFRDQPPPPPPNLAPMVTLGSSVIVFACVCWV